MGAKFAANVENSGAGAGDTIVAATGGGEGGKEIGSGAGDNATAATGGGAGANTGRSIGTGEGSGAGEGTGPGDNATMGTGGEGHGATFGASFGVVTGSSGTSGAGSFSHRGCSKVASLLEWRPGTIVTGGGTFCPQGVCRLSRPRRPFWLLT